MLYYYHAATPRPGAKAVLWAGDLPIVWDCAVGKGSSAVFLGTTLGEAQAGGETPFWAWSGWPTLLGKIVMQ